MTRPMPSQRLKGRKSSVAGLTLVSIETRLRRRAAAASSAFGSSRDWPRVRRMRQLAKSSSSSELSCCNKSKELAGEEAELELTII